MEYVLKVKRDKKGIALINHLKSLDFVELNKNENATDPVAFREMIKNAERSKPMSMDEAKKKSA
ncbi:MAG TPA: hypothetical protein PLD84_11970, partial [Chitinophagales bacterium]|nr:hypothetical protein [Chitinophagales bacterium]